MTGRDMQIWVFLLILGATGAACHPSAPPAPEGVPMVTVHEPEGDADRAFHAQDRRFISLRDSTGIRTPGLDGMAIEMDQATEIRIIDAAAASKVLDIEPAAVEDYVARYNRAMLRQWAEGS